MDINDLPLLVAACIVSTVFSANHHGPPVEHSNVDFHYDPEGKYLVAETASRCFLAKLTRDEQDHVHTNTGMDDLEIVSIILIGVAAYCRLAAIIVSLTLIGGIIACGVFLFFIALVGLLGAVKHHQVLLFFYMIILFLLFLLQFSLGCACLAVNKDQEISLVKHAWKYSDASLKDKIQLRLNCCGFENPGLNMSESMGHPACNVVPCCKGHEDDPCCSGEAATEDSTCHCSTCLEIVRDKIDQAFSLSGGVGLFFSFTEIMGVWLALRYRNQKDPKANPSAFL